MKNKQALHENFLKLEYKCVEVPQSFILMHPFLSLLLFRGYLNSSVIRINKMANSVNTLFFVIYIDPKL